MRHEITENHLKRGAYGFRFVADLPLSKINLKEARQNPARLLTKTDEGRVMEIAMAMLDGVPMPAIVVFDVGGELYLLCTGLHRIEAAVDAGLDKLDAYIVAEPDEFRRDLLISSINTIEGHAPTTPENALLALRLHQRHGRSLNDIAKAFGLKASTLTAYKHEADFDQRCKDLDVTIGTDRRPFPQRLKIALRRVANDQVFVRTARAIEDMDLRGDRAGLLIDEVIAAKTDRNRFKLLDLREQEHADELERAKAKLGKRGRREPIPARLMNDVRRIYRLLEGRSLASLGLGTLDPSEYKTDFKRLEFIVDKLVAIKDEFYKMITAHEKAKSWRILPSKDAA